MRRWLPIAAVALTAATTIPFLAYALRALGEPSGDEGSPLWLVVSASMYGSLGALLALRRPGQVIPWILLGLGACMAWSAGLSAFELRGGTALSGLDAALYLGFTVLVASMVQLFPTGRPLTRRWTVVLWMLLVGSALLILAQLLGIGEGTSAALVRPIGAAVVAVYAIGMASTLPALVVRFHRATGAERAQLKWFLLGVAVFAVAWFAPDDILGAPQRSVVNIGGLAPAVAIAIALSRYRLYDIDRIISRTVSYAVVTAVLVGTYAVIVTGVTRLLPTSSTLAVAAATLAAATVARPLLRRVQGVVDARFNRSRYDAQRTVDSFGERLRNEVESGAVVADLRGVVAMTLEPKAVALWLR